MAKNNKAANAAKKEVKISKAERSRLKQERLAAENKEKMTLHINIKRVLGGAIPQSVVNGSYQEVLAFKKTLSSIERRLDCVTLLPLQKAWADCCRLWSIKP